MCLLYEVMMDEYTAFAKVYDEFMDNVPYDDWTEYIVSLLKEYDVKDKDLVLDLGCGTGKITRRLRDCGYDLIGVDSSVEMLDIAIEKESDRQEKEDGSILYLNQDMRELDLYGTVKAVVSICDCMNYITDFDDLVTVFKLVNVFLDPKGVFIFDLNTEYKYTSIGETVIAEDREDKSFIWDNYYDEDEKINSYGLSVFIKADDGRFDKYSEEHFQRAYSLDEIKTAIKLAGMEFVTAYDAFTRDEVRNDSERIYVICRECGK